MDGTDEREQQRKRRVVQLRAVPIGRGVVELRFVTATGDRSQPGCHLMYPEQGRLIGAAPVDVANAEKLNAAAAELNKVLDELCA